MVEWWRGLLKKLFPAFSFLPHLLMQQRGKKAANQHTAHGHKGQRAWDIAANRKQRD